MVAMTTSYSEEVLCSVQEGMQEWAKVTGNAM